MTNVLCVVGHPDDAELMAGGTIAKHIAAKDKVRVLVLCETRASKYFVKAAEVLGFEGIQSGFQDQLLDTIPLVNVIEAIEQQVEKFRPEVIYTHWRHDLNRDHQIVAEAAEVACRPIPDFPVKIILQGEVPSSSEWAGGFNPTWFSDVSLYMEEKMKALECYKSEMRPWPHARSEMNIRALARHRGATAGVGAAEAFVVRRVIS